MTNTNTQPPDEPEWEPSTPDPAWQPRDAEDVQGLYGPEAAKAWLGASESQRRGIIRQLLSDGTPAFSFAEPADERTERKRIKRERELKVLTMTDDEFAALMLKQHERTLEIRAMALSPNPELAESIRQAKGKFAALRPGLLLALEQLEKQPKPADRDARAELSAAINKADEALVKCIVRGTVVECLEEGALTVAECMGRLEQEDLLGGVAPEDLADICINYIDHLLNVKLALPQTPQQ